MQNQNALFRSPKSEKIKDSESKPTVWYNFLYLKNSIPSTVESDSSYNTRLKYSNKHFL